jgi:hypothetical protein
LTACGTQVCQFDVSGFRMRSFTDFGGHL